MSSSVWRSVIRERGIMSLLDRLSRRSSDKKSRRNMDRSGSMQRSVSQERGYYEPPGTNDGRATAPEPFSSKATAIKRKYFAVTSPH